MCNGTILHNQYKYTCTDPVFTLHRLPSRRNCYIKPLKCFAHNTSHVLYKRVVVVKVGEGCHLKTLNCIYTMQDSRCHHCAVFLNMKCFKCHHMSACDSDLDTVVEEMAFIISLKAALTLLDSRGGQNITRV